MVLSSFTLSVSASDFRTGGREVGGTYVSYSHFLTYTDVRCGMNTQAHYHADASRALGEIGVKWSVTSVFTGGTLDSGGISHSNRSSLRDSSANYLPINQSRANYSISNNGSTWTPLSIAYHCTSLSSAEVAGEQSESGDIDRDTLKGLYFQIKEDKNTLNSNLEQNIPAIIERQLANNMTDVSEYTFEDGEEVSVNDFQIINLGAENSKSPVADGVTFYNPEGDNTTIIELEVKDKVFKDENTYKLTGYLVFIDNQDQNFESGIYAELIEQTLH